MSETKKLEQEAVKNMLHNMALDKHLSSVYSEVDGLSLQNLFYVKNGYFPYCDMFTQSREESENYFDTKSLIAELKEKYKEVGYQMVVYSNINLSKNEKNIGFSIIIPTLNIFARIEKSVSEAYILYGEDDAEALEEFEEICKKHYKTPDKKLNNIRLLRVTQQGYDLSDFEIDTVEDFNLEEQYNDDFIPEDEKITAFVKKEKSGIIILHGEKGTGKSTYINHLINTNPEKMFVYFPSALVPLLGEPSFTDFFPRLKDSILILEDCEDALRSREAVGGNRAVNQLLNLSDGLLKSLGIKFICTFNAPPEEIDEALLRKGRLFSKYEFKKLDAEKSSALLSKLYEKEITVTEPMSLADIYYYDETSYEDAPRETIGFA
jgi:SpoVK/Ycf46/Vps4 family AAA+-type ATPase